MKKSTKLGIWMDHASANLMEFSTDITSKTIESKFTQEAKEASFEKGENGMHQREQHQQASFYKDLMEEIRNHTDVVLFGPTQAKKELFNLIKRDHLFTTINIDCIQTDKMTENQQHAFVRNHFSKHNSHL